MSNIHLYSYAIPEQDVPILRLKGEHLSLKPEIVITDPKSIHAIQQVVMWILDHRPEHHIAGCGAALSEGVPVPIQDYFSLKIADAVAEGETRIAELAKAKQRRVYMHVQSTSRPLAQHVIWLVLKDSPTMEAPTTWTWVHVNLEVMQQLFDCCPQLPPEGSLSSMGMTPSTF